MFQYRRLILYLTSSGLWPLTIRTNNTERVRAKIFRDVRQYIRLTLRQNSCAAPIK
ncbi:hypothetical protein U716_13420 [Rhodobacter capsulatus B6]|nr:hypothetical protein U716_13420 [Rhodobacter capsulatus B6]